jgi:hypothetical protein
VHQLQPRAGGKVEKVGCEAGVWIGVLVAGAGLEVGRVEGLEGFQVFGPDGDMFDVCDGTYLLGERSGSKKAAAYKSGSSPP